MADEQSNTIEEWRPVVGWEGIYSVSNFGRVRRDITCHGNPCVRILHPSKVRDRRQIRLRFGEKIRYRYVHGLVAEAFLGPCPAFHEVNHIDNNPSNNHVSNLEYLTHDENMKYMAKQGRTNRSGAVLARKLNPEKFRGEQVAGAKLTEKEVLQIRSLYAQGGTSLSKLAAQFGVSKGVIQHIVAYRTWRHVL